MTYEVTPIISKKALVITLLVAFAAFVAILSGLTSHQPVNPMSITKTSHSHVILPSGLQLTKPNGYQY